MRKNVAYGSAAAVVLLASVATAAVVLDENGTGFIGKGDIQSIFGWNNAQLQANAGQIRFVFTTSASASWECEWWTGPDHNRKYHSITVSSEQDVDAAIAYDARANKKGQVTGFNLLGFSSANETTDGGAVGECDGNKTLVPDSVVLNGVTDEGTLWVVFEGTRVAVPLGLDQ